MNNIENASANLTSAESRIRDAEIAAEIIQTHKNQIITPQAPRMLVQHTALWQCADFAPKIIIPAFFF
jgi:flagellin